MAKKKVKKKVQSEAEPSFEQALASLSEVVGQIESGDLSLDDALGQYERGITLLKTCHAQLSRAQRRIEVLSRIDDDGNATTTPYDDSEDESLEAKQQSRSRRRTREAGEGGSLF